MKRLSIYLLIFCSSLWLLEQAYTAYLKANVNIKSSYVARKKINADVLFLGTSNTLFGIIPDIFEATSGKTMYNLATNHSSFEENLAHLHLYLQNNRKPQLLVIGISLTDLTVSHWTFHSFFFAPFNNDSLISNLIYKNDQFYWYVSHIPFMKYAYYNEFSNACAFKGFTHIAEHCTTAYFAKGTYYTPSDTIGFLHFRQMASTYHHPIAYNLSFDEEQQLKTLLEYAQAKSIRVLLYEPAYWTHINKDYAGRNAAIAHLQTIAEQYHSNYWTFDTLAFCGKRENFISVFHTSGSAAKDFTKILAEKLNASGLLTLPACTKVP